MKHRLLALGILAALAVAACSPDSDTGPAGDPSAPDLGAAAQRGSLVPDQYIVVFHDRVTDAPALARRLAADAGGTLRFTYTRAIKGFSAKMSAAAADRLRGHPDVKYVEQDGVVSITTDQTNATWGLDRVDQRNLPLNTIYTYNTTASNVTAYILDTGIRTSHNDFGGRASVGFDAIGDGQNGQDCNGHGTHVSGTVGGTTYGVAKGVALVAVRVLNCGGSGTYDQVIAGVDWVTANADLPAVANMSLGGSLNQALNDAVTASIAAGVFYALAAGNNADNACSYSPAATPNATTVGATDASDVEAWFSNYGTCVDILAPGVNITSDWYTSNTATNTISGTSMASPHVAGAAALWLAEHPSDTPAQVNSALESNATPDVIDLNNGPGTPNLLLYTLFGSAPPPPPPGENTPPDAAFTWSCSTLNCTFNNNSSDADGSVVKSVWNWGDGSTTTSNDPQVTHTYRRGGTYKVKLTVTDDDGATDEVSQSVRVRRWR